MEKIKCQICGREFKNINGLSAHLSNRKSSCYINVKEYYDKYIRKDKEGICILCGNETGFNSLNKGYYSDICGKCNNKNSNIDKNKKRSLSLKNTLKKKSKLLYLRKVLIGILRILSIDKNNKLQCQLCGLKYKRYDSLAKHISRGHNQSIELYYNRFMLVDINEGKCKVCNSKTSFSSLEKGYCKYCSPKCVSVSPEVRNSFKNTCINKYNVEHPTKFLDINKKQKEGINKAIKERGSEIIEKRKETCRKKYNVDYITQTEFIKDAIRKSIKIMKESGIFKDLQNKKFLTYYNNIFKERMEKILVDRNLELIGVYQKAHNLSKFKCTKCGYEFEELWMSIQQGKECPSCNPKSNSLSKPEDDLSEFIKNLGFQIERNNRRFIKPFELDIIIKSDKVAFEYCGLRWHSEEFINLKTYHKYKLERCLEKGFRLITINEDEWLYKKDIVENKIRYLLKKNITNTKIYARQCSIKEIDPKIKNEFLDKFHLQGRDSSVVKLGLFYNNILVSVMTFSHGNISKGSISEKNIWELNRFCSDYNYIVVGSASKLLTHFKRNYDWKEIFSYADRRWSNGDLYYKLGFELSHITSPNYWYIKNCKRYHRFALRKRLGEPKNIPEWLLRYREGYERIWDCGNYKFIMKNKGEK